ncbi:MAG: hypothetical protein ACJ8EB_07770 [Allosphingosinicella sp.]|jgi:hypothetical protein
MQTAATTAFSLAILAAFALAAGGAWLIAARKAPKQGALMLVMAAVLVANVLIWTL